MCCFIVPMVQAVATTAYRKHCEKHQTGDHTGLKSRVSDLEKMLWGGTVMLIVDHIINGELSWAFPFFTALGQEGGAEVMLREILSVGVPMSVVITAVWAIWALLKTRKQAGVQRA